MNEHQVKEALARVRNDIEINKNEISPESNAFRDDLVLICNTLEGCLDSHEKTTEFDPISGEDL